MFLRNLPACGWIIVSVATDIEPGKLEDGSVVSPAGLGKVDGSVAGPVLGDHLGADPERPGAGDALHRHVAPLRDHGAAVPEGELGGLLAEVALASDGGVLLVEAPGHHILLGLRRTTQM